MAASYAVGALAGLIYLRLLNKSVDGVGGGIGGAISQNRLLIPLILALGYNRWAGGCAVCAQGGVGEYQCSGVMLLLPPCWPFSCLWLAK